MATKQTTAEKAIANKRKQVIDELGTIQQRLRVAKADEPKEAELKAEVRSWTSGLAPEVSTYMDGTGFRVDIGAAGNETSITSMEAVYELLGKDEFLANCSFPLTALRNLLAPSQVALVTRTARTATRTVSTSQRLVAA